MACRLTAAEYWTSRRRGFDFGIFGRCGSRWSSGHGDCGNGCDAIEVMLEFQLSTRLSTKTELPFARIDGRCLRPFCAASWRRWWEEIGRAMIFSLAGDGH